MGKAIIIHVSFKENVEELKLYNWINSHSGKSAFIKDVLKDKMKNEELDKNR